MITVCMDTSHVFLALGIIRDDRVIASFQESCWKKQSEAGDREAIQVSVLR